MAVATSRKQREKGGKKPERTKIKLRTGDTVQVMTGKDAGRRGKVVRVVPEKNRLVVEQLNIVKRHTKPRPSTNPQQAARQQPTGGVIDQEAPLSVSNVQLVCPSCDQPTRVGFTIRDDGRKVRVCRKCQSPIETK